MSTVTEAQEFGDALKRLREERGWTRPELMRRLQEVDPGYDWSVQKIAHLERGNVRHPQLRHLRLLSIVLGCDISDLVWPTGGNRPQRGWYVSGQSDQQEPMLDLAA